MDDDYTFLNDLIDIPLIAPTRWYDYYTFWSVILFFITLILILIDQFKEFLPGWWIAFIFANTIFVGIMGTLIVTINIDHQMNKNSRDRLEYAYSQLFFHTIPMLIGVVLLLLFPTILKSFEVWQVIIAFAAIFTLYMITPSSHNKNMLFGKLNEVYYNPNKFLLFVTGIAVLSLIVFIEKHLITLHTDK